MFQIYNCLVNEHDWRLVVIAGLICLLASLVTITLLHRAMITRRRARAMWLVISAAATGCGIWTTHFVAMLAYDPNVPVGYDVTLTLFSLLSAANVAGLGLALAVYAP